MAFNLEEYFFPMPGSEKEKDIVIFARRHWISFLGDILVSIFLLIVPIIIIIVVHVLLPNVFQGRFLNFLMVFGSAYYLVITTFIFSAWITYYYDIYILTKDLIIDITQSGFFNRKISQLSLLRVQDVSSKINGLLPTLFAYGDVLVETAGERVENFLLPAIPNPQAFSAKVLELHDQLIEREGRHRQIMDGEGLLMPNHKKVENIPEANNPQNESGILNPVDTQPREVEPENKNANCSPEKNNSGEIDKNDLNQGGEVKL